MVNYGDGLLLVCTKMSKMSDGDLICVPSSELHALTSPWPFSAWGVDVIEKVSPKSSSGHEYILVTIDFSPNGWRPHLMLA